MKRINLLHNPGAGNEDHFEEELIRDIESEGFSCKYFSISEAHWKKRLDETDFIVVAGGDGTVRNVMKELVKGKSDAPLVPVAVLPMGTANNLSHTLGIDPTKDHLEQIRKWKLERYYIFDLGFIRTPKGKDMFLESVGFGVFPALINYMKHREEPDVAETAETKLRLALEVMAMMVRTFEPIPCSVKAEGTTKDLPCILLEVMNTQSIGPNLFLAPDADTADGFFDVVYVLEDQREDFALYLQQLSEGRESHFDFKSFKCQSMEIEAEGHWMHVDDELKELNESISMYVETGKKQIRFMV